MRPMMLAQTRLLEPKAAPRRCDAAISMASDVIPEVNTVRYKYALELGFKRLPQGEIGEIGLIITYFIRGKKWG